jgi:uncharacterized membrane protein YfcA
VHLVVVVIVAVAFGAFAQTTTGIGFALAVAPACALAFEPAIVIGTVARLAVVADVAVVMTGVGDLDVGIALRYLWPAVLAVPLAALATAVLPVTVVVTGAAAATLGTVCVTAVFPVGRRATVTGRRDRWTGTVSGFAAGFLGVTAGLSGPPVALHTTLSGRPLARSRSTLALFFLVIDVVAALTHPRSAETHVMITLVGAAAIGIVVGGRVARVVDESVLRPALLVIVAASGVAAMARIAF